jgi:O-antigen ligase
MPALARVTLVALVAYTGLSMALETALDESFHANVGPINVYLFDMLLFAAVMLLMHEVVARHGQGIPTSNRVVVFLVLGYCAYQLAIVLPVSVVLHDLAPIGVIRELEVRLGLVLLPFMYLVVLRYVSPQRVVLLVNAAAVVLAMYVAYRYATIGPVYGGGSRLRELGGSAIFLFAFLIISSLFLQRPSIITYAAAMLGTVGIALTNHRSGYLALFAVGIPLFFHFRRATPRTVVVLIVLISSAVLLVSASPAVRESAYYSLRTMVNPTADQNARDRVDRSRLGWDYFVANPLGDHAWNQRFYLVDLPDPFEPHNFVIQILDAQGIVGFAFFAAIIVTVVRIAWRNRSADRMSAVMLAYFVFYLLFCLLNTSIVNQWNILLLAVPVGLILKRNADLLEDGRKDTMNGDPLPARTGVSGARAA